MARTEQETSQLTMRELVDILKVYSYHYYVLDKPLTEDEEYDSIKTELKRLEELEGIILADSPNRIYGLPHGEKEQKVKTGQTIYNEFNQIALKKQARQKGETIDYFADDYCSIDIETTGFSRKKDQIIEIGIIKVRNGIIVDSYEQLINPKVSIPWYITKLTGITNEMVIDKPTIDVVLPEVKEFIDNDVLLGYSILTFDSSFLYDNFLRHCNHVMRNEIADAYNIAKRNIEEQNWHREKFAGCSNFKLDTVAKYLNIDYINGHRALGDAETTHLVYEKLRQLKIDGNVPYTNVVGLFEFCKNIADIQQNNSKLHGKTFVISGALQTLTRDEAVKKIENLGGIILSSVSEDLNYLVSDVTNTSKYLKARQLQEQKFPLEIISERALLEMLSVSANDSLNNKILDNTPARPRINFAKKRLCLSELVATTSLKKIDSDFFEKVFAFTGDLENFTRTEASKVIIEGGGIIKSGVSKGINYLIRGKELPFTTKIDKVNDLISKGYPIKIIDEDTFIEMINNNT